MLVIRVISVWVWHKLNVDERPCNTIVNCYLHNPSSFSEQWIRNTSFCIVLRCYIKPGWWRRNVSMPLGTFLSDTFLFKGNTGGFNNEDSTVCHKVSFAVWKDWLKRWKCSGTWQFHFTGWIIYLDQVLSYDYVIIKIPGVAP